LFLIDISGVHLPHSSPANHFTNVMRTHSATSDYRHPLSNLFDQNGDSLYAVEGGARTTGSEYPLKADVDELFDGSRLIR